MGSLELFNRLDILKTETDIHNKSAHGETYIKSVPNLDKKSP